MFLPSKHEMSKNIVFLVTQICAITILELYQTATIRATILLIRAVTGLRPFKVKISSNLVQDLVKGESLPDICIKSLFQKNIFVRFAMCLVLD